MTQERQSNTDTWLEIGVEVAGIDAELAADLLRQACPGGVAIEPASRFDPASDAYVVDGDAPALVRGFLKAGPDSERIRRSLRLALSMAPLGRPARWRRVRRLREESWRDSWKKHFAIQRIGKAVVVKPSWTHYPLKGGETVIEIDPGMAFGTGQHPTTAMCLRALEELIRPGDAVLDLGCGSGILAVAAAKLGASRVLALDVDPNAVKAARENIAANAVSHLVEIREGTLAVDAPRWGAGGPDVETPRRRVPSGSEADDVFNLVAANINALTLERLAPALARSLSRSGVLITSGFLEDAVEDLTRAYRGEGLSIDRIVEEGVWRAIIARRSV